MVVGKLFKSDFISLEEAWRWAEKEYSNLKLLRGRFGMDKGAYRVAAPLGKNKDLSALLVTEMFPGKILDYYVAKAIYEQQIKRLFDKLCYLARFFVKLHRNGETDRQVSPDLPWRYLGKLLHSLSKGPLTPSKRKNIKKYAANWWDKKDIFADREVIVHIGHFLWEYAVNYNYRDPQFFYAITRKVPLYMSLGLLRIARNNWLDVPHRKNLIMEAKRCLKYGL